MHKGVILLCKAESREEALKKVKEFLEPYYEAEWDWYTVGGRWTGTLKGNEAVQDRDAYKEDGYEDDCIPLGQVLVRVLKEWGWSPKKKIEEALKHANKEKDEGMRGYYLSKAGDLMQQRFSFEADIFNTEDWDYSVPETCEGWWATMVDLHN